MSDLVQPSEEELRELVKLVEGVLLEQRAVPLAHRTLQFRHGPSDEMLPYVLDFLVARDCQIVNVFTLVLRDGAIHREVTFRVCACAVVLGPVR